MSRELGEGAVETLAGYAWEAYRAFHGAPPPHPWPDGDRARWIAAVDRVLTDYDPEWPSIRAGL